MRITKENVTETESNQFAVEASDLGLKPGNMPGSFETDLGNGLPLVQFDRHAISAHYMQEGGDVFLTVYND